MTIPKVQAGETVYRFRQPFFFAPPSVQVFYRETVTVLVRFAIVLVVVLSVAGVSSAAPARLLTARFTGDCDGFTIEVTGDGVNQPNPTVSYNIKLTPRSGEPLIIVDSFKVLPEKDGKFHGTARGTWKKFEYTLMDKFTLSGSAILISDLVLLHDIPVTFSHAKLNCRRRR